MSITQIIIIVTFITFIVIGLLAKKSSMTSYSDFTMSKGKLNWFTIATGISMTFAGGAAILTTASVGFNFKWYSLIDPIALMIGLVIVLFFYRRYEQDKGTTISDLLASDDKGLSILIGVVTSFAFILIVATNFVALAKLLSPYFPGVNPLLITFVASTLVFAYVFWGGFNSVTRTDILQYVLIAAFLIVPILVFLIKNHGQVITGTTSHEFVAMPIDYIILFSIPILFTPLSQDINLRIKSAKSPVNGKVGLIMGGVFYFSIALSAAYVGIHLGNTGAELTDPEQAIPIFFKDNFPKVGFLAIIATLAAIVSTMDSYILNSITAISNDVINPLSKGKDNVKKTIIIASVVTYVIAMVIALFFQKVLALSLTSMLTYISVLLPIALGNSLRLPGRQVFIASIISIAAIMIVEILSLPVTPKAVIYPLLGCSLMLILRLINVLRNERS